MVKKKLSGERVPRPSFTYKNYKALIEYTQILEKRITVIEEILSISAPKEFKKSIVGTNLIVARRQALEIVHCIKAINQYFNTTTEQWLNKSREVDTVDVRYVFLYLLIEFYKIDNPIILSKRLKKFNYTMDRSNIYHVKEKYEEDLVRTDIRSIERIKHFNELKELL